ncbi:MAG TPA: hypothetical protein VLA72_11495, partial [Anaerolineales bacterium]|nr:hypothetical protein [Anaerolineales bacterium]
MMKKMFQKTLLIAMVATMAVASLPVMSASAAPATDDPPPQREVSAERLERVWARQLRLYEKIGKGYERSDGFVEKVQTLIDKA